MMSLEFETANAAFDDENREEVARILEEVADQVRREVTPDGGMIRDVNGNRVGAWRLTFDGDGSRENG